MEVKDLEKKWQTLSTLEARDDYRTIRVEKDCLAEVYLGLSSSDRRCLILRLPRRIEFRRSTTDKLEMVFNRDVGGLILELTDAQVEQEFNELVLSLYRNIKDISSVDLYTAKFIECFGRWSSLFDRQPDGSLSDADVQGLFGELYVLIQLLHERSDQSADELSRSWRGPYREPQDFQLEDKSIEVKTIGPKGNVVEIHGLQQLYVESGRTLELMVLRVERDFNAGQSLETIFNSAKELLLHLGGDPLILYEALAQKGVSNDTLPDYDLLRFCPRKISAYDASSDRFPKLTPKNVSSAITKIPAYTLNITELVEFCLVDKDI